MAKKSNSIKTTPVKKDIEKPAASRSKMKTEEELDSEDDLDEPEEKPGKTGRPSKGKKLSDDDDEDDMEIDDLPEEDDDWNKEEEDSWDPDFEEFDLPKSKSKSGGAGKSKLIEDDLDADEDLKEFDMFNDDVNSGIDDDDF